MMKILMRFVRNLGYRLKTSGLSREHSHYSKFIILGYARTGTNFLRTLLNSHPQILTFGEIFNQNFLEDTGHTILWGKDGFPQDEAIKRLLQHQPIAFLEKHIFPKVPREISAVGFKIFYYHAREDEAWRPVWPWLKAQEDIKILHVKRKNCLKTFVSRKKAFLTDRWVNNTGDDEPNVSFELDYEECLQQFIRIRAFEQEYDRIFEKHDSLEVRYEDLSRNYIPHMQKIQEFLGVSPQENLSTRLHKQSRQPLSETISNYHDLKEQFKNSPWQEFFEE